ncbi:hypothetical protein H257_10653 [Aphanomyces astaci]|uniref:Uncharacterized protein n=1 Tax=Aphanomyces astaci TaxID=112090 RepID=W4G804_APHAT|nr:hypothetical protein H257_10653 [Aphanomyces astaci]ETV75053.1 hypothetical protein H257_10653 [Aphanomyces astaci]|eukprot:XP_009835557.1 hypothetical protein H257_10653 [Aphanomyces astaci]
MSFASSTPAMLLHLTRLRMLSRWMRTTWGPSTPFATLHESESILALAEIRLAFLAPCYYAHDVALNAATSGPVIALLARIRLDDYTILPGHVRLLHNVPYSQKPRKPLDGHSDTHDRLSLLLDQPSEVPRASPHATSVSTTTPLHLLLSNSLPPVSSFKKPSFKTTTTSVPFDATSPSTLDMASSSFTRMTTEPTCMGLTPTVAKVSTRFSSHLCPGSHRSNYSGHCAYPSDTSFFERSGIPPPSTSTT